jgi:hypothetical protein
MRKVLPGTLLSCIPARAPGDILPFVCGMTEKPWKHGAHFHADDIPGCIAIQIKSPHKYENPYC